MIEVVRLSRLSAAGCRSLEYEAETSVDVFGASEEVVVRKTYQNRGRRLWQSFARRSRAQREHDHLIAIAAAGVPCLLPIGWSEWRHVG